MTGYWTLHEAMAFGHGVERPFLCPVHGDTNASASVNTIKNVWYCYSCGASGGVTGEDALIDPDYDQMAYWLSQQLEEDRVYPESWLDQYTAGRVHPYWSARVGDDAARHFRLGYDVEGDCYTYPLRTTGSEVLGVVRRRSDALGTGDAAGPKYKYPRGVDVSCLLFNYSPTYRRVVVLCEGALDAIALWNVGVHAFAIYGARLSAHQVELIERVDPEWVVTAYDADRAGNDARYETERAFRHRFVDHLTWHPRLGKDVDELDREVLRNLASHLVCDDITCLESSTCRSRRSGKTPTTPHSTRSTRSTSTRRRPLIVRTTT